MTTLRFDGRSVRLAAHSSGNPDDPAVLFLHGGRQTRHAWGNAIERLAAEGYWAITLDLRGHGESDWAPDRDYSLDAYVLDLRHVLRQLPRQPALVGASLGGLTSMLMVGESAEQTCWALVLVDIAPRIEDAGADRIQRFTRGYPDGFASLQDAADAVAAYLPQRRRPVDPAGLTKNLRLRGDGRWHWHWDPALNDFDRPTPAVRQRLSEAVRNTRVPTLLVRGALSDVLSDDGVRDFQQLLPSGRVVEVGEAGHMVAGDVNDPFVSAVTNFLHDVRPHPAGERVPST